MPGFFTLHSKFSSEMTENVGQNYHANVLLYLDRFIKYAVNFSSLVENSAFFVSSRRDKRETVINIMIVYNTKRYEWLSVICLKMNHYVVLL